MFNKIAKYFNKLFSTVSDFDKHISGYKSISKEPAIPSYAYINWGMHLINSGDKKNGLDKLYQSIVINKYNPEAYINIGIILAQNGEFDEALSNFKKAVKYDSSNARAWGFLAGAYSELEDNTHAKSAFEKSIKLDRTNPYTYLNYGIFCIKTKQNSTAKLMLKRAYLLNPSNAQPLIMWGVILLGENEHRNAFLKFKKALTIEPFNAEVLHLCGVCSFKNEDYTNCINFCKKSITFNPDKKENYLLITESYLNLENKEKCFENFEKFENLCKDDWKYYHSWGLACQHFNMHDIAIEKFNKAVELNNSQYAVYAALSCSLIITEDLHNAKEAINNVLRLNPQCAQSYYNLGQIEMRMQDYDAAINSYKKAISIDSSLKKAYFNIAGAYHSKNDSKNAIKYWEKAAEYDSKNPNTFLNLATIYYTNVQDYPKALRYIRCAYDIDKTNTDVLLKYGLILLKNCDFYRAIDKFEELLKIDDKMQIANLAIAECCLKNSKFDKALEYLYKSKEEYGGSKDYLLLELVITSEKSKAEKKFIEQKDTILELCDRIIKDYGENPTVEEIKTAYLKP